MTRMQAGFVASTLVTAVTLILFWVSSCSQGFVDEQARVVVAGGGDAPTIRLSAISPTEAGVLDSVSIEVEPGEGGYDVVVAATNDLASYGDLFLKLEYDPAAHRVHGLRNSVAELRSEVIGLALEVEPGLVEFGAVAVGTIQANGEPAALMSGVATLGDELLYFKLLPGASERQGSPVAASSNARPRNLQLAQLDDGSSELSWDYTNPGDTNQDGVVDIQDLAPIGRKYLAKVSNSVSDPLRHLDVNGDGEINLPDTTSIAQNYSMEVFAYQVEMSQDGESSFITVGQLLMGDQTIDPGRTYRFYYALGAQFVPGSWYRVVALDRNLAFGPPSEAINEEGRRIAQANMSAANASGS